MPGPLIERLPLDCPATALLPALARRRAPIALLSSSTGGNWDILTADPQRLLCQHGGRLQQYDAAGQATMIAGPAFAVLEGWLADAPGPAIPGLPFAGGLAGYWGYESTLAAHGLPDGKPGPALPDLWVGDYRWALLRERRSGRWQLVADTTAQARAVKDWLATAVATPAPAFGLAAPFRCDWPEAGYAAAFQRTHDYLLAGDCYQVNLARPFSAPYHGSPLAAFLRLVHAHAAPYSAYIGLPDGQAVLSLSPENFLTRDAGGHVVTRPIKGTRPRRADPADDRREAEALAGSEKDRAENLMIVDLLRNDLGRCCVPGSIRVSELFALESHPNVHHLASTVEGQCRPGVGPLAVLAACFPGGSITGAPKQRAMEIIAELEPLRRSAYCGAIGYIGRDGQMNTSIAIRTLVADGHRLHCWGGSGIVADSVCAEEFRECEDKVRAFMQALETPVA